MKALIALLISLFFHLSITQAQTYPNKEFTEPQSYAPTSPVFSSLYKFSQFPLDHASGSVTTNIPIFEGSSGRIKVPISISYTSNGNRVQDIASSIGLGWNLNYGYSITIEEEEPKPFPYSSKIYKDENAAVSATNLNSTWMLEMKRSADGYYQTMFPTYRYKCGNFSGIFYFDANNDFKHIGRMSNLKVEKITLGGTNLTGFKLTTNDGLEYTFDKLESTLRLAQQNALGPQKTAFLCTRIKDLLNDDTVLFTYVQNPTYTTYSESSTIRYYYGPYPQPSGNMLWSPESDMYKVTMYDVNSWTISRIDFSDSYVTFETAADRLDISPMRIKSASVYSEAMGNVRISKVDFDQSYFQTSNGSKPQYNYRLKLDGVTFNSIEYPSAIPIQKYKFTYSSIQLPPYRIISNSREQNYEGIDYWGFYNGPDNGNSTIPIDIKNEFNSHNPSTLPNWGIDRKANPNYTQACILTEVRYPTGGKATFDYENHRLPGYYLGEYLGGVRIKEIKYFDSETNPSPSIDKSFAYLNAQALTPVSMSTYAYSSFKSKAHYADGLYPGVTATSFSYAVGIISSDPLYAFAYHNGSPLFYEKVEEYEGTGLSNNGKTVFTYNYNAPYYCPTNFEDLGGKKLMAEHWSRGQLLKKEVYKNTGNTTNPYQKISQEINTLGFTTPTTPYIIPMVGFGVRKKSQFQLFGSVPGSWDIVGDLADSFYIMDYPTKQNIPKDAFVYNNFYFRAGTEPVVVKNEVSTFIDNHELKITTDYLYNSPNHEQLAEVTVTDSKGSIKKREFRYVEDRSSILNLSPAESIAFDRLIDLNKFNDIIEEKTYLNNVLTQQSRDRYTLRSNIPVISTKEFTNYLNNVPSKNSLNIKSYNNKLMPLNVQKEEAPVISYIWDDYNVNLIAKVTNSDSKTICYTSFEPGAKGNWETNHTNTYDISAYTGNYVYMLDPSTTLSALVSGGSSDYIVSYLSKNSSYNIPGTQSITSGSKSTKGWTYYEHLVTGQSIINIYGTGAIDELRMYPAGAQMISYTYYPLSGLNSTADEKSMAIKYKYDGFRRLNQIIDQNGNILKTYNYNYKP